MQRNYGVTLEGLGHDSSLEVDVQYQVHPGEPMVWRYPDGSGYPGSPPEAELIGARVTRWDVGDDERPRNGSPWWDVLDRIAEAIIDREWQRYGDDCLEHADECEADHR